MEVEFFLRRNFNVGINNTSAGKVLTFKPHSVDKCFCELKVKSGFRVLRLLKPRSRRVTRRVLQTYCKLCFRNSDFGMLGKSSITLFPLNSESKF